MPERDASSMMYCRTGRSTTGSNSFGTALVAGRNRVARPAAGITALLARGRPDEAIRMTLSPSAAAYELDAG